MFFMDPFFWDLFVNGLLIGSMYALVALGFVLIYKATSVINFAQGDLVMFGGYNSPARTPPPQNPGRRRPLRGIPYHPRVLLPPEPDGENYAGRGRRPAVRDVGGHQR